MFAVGVDTEVFVKYVDREPGMLILRSRNERYKPISVPMTGDLGHRPHHRPRGLVLPGIRRDIVKTIRRNPSENSKLSVVGVFAPPPSRPGSAPKSAPIGLFSSHYFPLPPAISRFPASQNYVSGHRWWV
jgi:hypothetical protein